MPVNKTKYFRLRLSDKVSTERPETDMSLSSKGGHFQMR